MIRSLKILALAAMALAALGAVGTTGASASEVHCEVSAGENCIITISPDGTGKNAHFVLVVKKGATSSTVTCDGATAQATTARTATQLTVTNLAFINCNAVGTPVTITTTGCDELYDANGGKVSVVCEAGKSFIISAGACVVTIGSQALSGVGYTNINGKKEITASTAVKNIAGTAGAGCAGLLGFTGAFTEGEFATGNTIVKAFRDVSGSEGAQVNFWWE